MNPSLKWTVVYVLMALAAAVLFFLGQWGAATTVLAVTVLINRTVHIGTLLERTLYQNRNIAEELVKLRKAATDDTA